MFLVGAIAFGATLAAQSGTVETVTGPMLLLLGVSLVLEIAAGTVGLL